MQPEMAKPKYDDFFSYYKKARMSNLIKMNTRHLKKQMNQDEKAHSRKTTTRTRLCGTRSSITKNHQGNANPSKE